MSASHAYSVSHVIQARIRRRPLTFGDFVAGVYHIWGERKAIGIVRLAVEVHVVEFRGKERFMISPTPGAEGHPGRAYPRLG
jgi:hypothetical protein